MIAEENQKNIKSFVLVPQKELSGSVLAREHEEVNQEILRQLKEIPDEALKTVNRSIKRSLTLTLQKLAFIKTVLLHGLRGTCGSDNY